MNLILFILFAQSLQQCLIKQGLSTQFFVNQTETIKFDLLDYFIGQNLTYSSDDITIYNTIYETSEFNTNTQIEGTAIFESQFNKEWLNYLAQVGTLNTQILVNIFKLDQGQLALDYSIFLPIQQYQLVCEDLAFIDNSNVIVDCYYINNTVQYNQFYIVSKNYAIPMIIPNTNISLANAPQYREMEVAHAQNKQTYLFRAAYNMSSHTGIMEVFTIPDGQLIQTYDKIVMSDFQIINYDLYLLNLTQTIYVYSLNDLSIPSQTYNLTNEIPSFVYLLAMDVDVSETAIWVYTDQIKDNLLEISQQQGIIKSHSIWIFDKSIKDYAQIQNNQKLVSLQIEDTIYFYAKRVQFDLISIVNQQLISLNQSPFTLLTYYNSYVFYSWITSPYAEAQFNTNTITNIQAKSENVFGTAICEQSFNFTIINEQNSSLNQKDTNFPPSAIANRQSLYYDIHHFASGPLIDYQAYSNLTVLFSNPSIQYNESSYVWQKIRGIDSFYSLDFDTYTQLIIESKLKNGKLMQSIITLRLCDIQLANRLFYVNNLDCTEYRGILNISAPIDKVEFTDITQSDEVYAVLNIASAAVVIYRFTSFSTFSHIKAQFVCEPLATDSDYRYQHGIDDFSVIGTNLYLILTRINQVWVYYIPECEKISEINTVTLNSSDFLPKYVIGEANLETNAAVGQLLFIGTYNQVLMIEFMDNKIPILQNVIDFPYNATKSMVSVVNQTLVMALQDDKDFHLLTYSYDQNQPSIKPKFQKELPLYNRRPDKDFVVNSDQQFYYIQMNNGYYYVYDPLLDTNDCLVYELGNIGDFITPTYIPNKSKQSIIMLSSLVTLVTYSLSNPQVIEVTFYPNDDQGYMTGVDYSITFSSNISSNNFTLINTTQLYDTLIIGSTNLTAFYDQNIGTYQESQSNGQIQLYLSNVINNNIVGYQLLQTNNFKLIKPFNSAQYTIQVMPKVDQMTSYPNNNSVFLQNTTGIYSYYNQTKRQIYNFNYIFSSCHLLEYQIDLLLSICSFYGTYYFSFFPDTDFYSPTIYTVKNIIYEPQKSLVFDDVVFTLAIHSLNSYYQIQLFNIVQAQMMYVLSLGCGTTGLEGDVGDFIVNKNDNSYIILYTCPFEQLVKYAVLSQDGTTFTTETSQIVDLDYGIILPKGALFLELIQFDDYILLTTREFYSFLFNLIMIQQNQYTINLKSWIAPMQDAILVKSTKYYNETLYMEYKTNNSQSLLASYNLTAPLPHLISSQMVLTFDEINYALITPIKQLCIYQQNYPLLIINSTNNLYIDYNNLDENVVYTNFLQINQRYGSNISLQFETEYQPYISHMEWWGYILIIIFIIVFFTGIGVIIYYVQQKKKQENQPQNEYLVISNHMELHSQEFQKK